MKNIANITIKLFIITVVAAALLGVVYSVTKEPIAQQAEKAATEARLMAFPEAAGFEDTKADIPEEYGIINNAYKALDKDGNVLGMVFGITTKGYSTGLNMTVGLGADGKIKNVIIGDNNETQGIGKEVAEPEFNGQFPGKPIDSPLNLVKSSPGEHDIQAISGATISSRAVTDAVNAAIEFYKQLGGAK